MLRYLLFISIFALIGTVIIVAIVELIRWANKEDNIKNLESKVNVINQKGVKRK